MGLVRKQRSTCRRNDPLVISDSDHVVLTMNWLARGTFGPKFLRLSRTHWAVRVPPNDSRSRAVLPRRARTWSMLRRVAGLAERAPGSRTAVVGKRTVGAGRAGQYSPWRGMPADCRLGPGAHVVLGRV